MEANFPNIWCVFGQGAKSRPNIKEIAVFRGKLRDFPPKAMISFNGHGFSRKNPLLRNWLQANSREALAKGPNFSRISKKKSWKGEALADDSKFHQALTATVNKKGY